MIDLAVRFPNQTKTKLFHEMKHGWVSRGDVRRSGVARDIEVAMSEAHKYFAEFLPLAPTTAYKTLRKIPDIYPMNTVRKDVMFESR